MCSLGNVHLRLRTSDFQVIFPKLYARSGYIHEVESNSELVEASVVSSPKLEDGKRGRIKFQVGFHAIHEWGFKSRYSIYGAGSRALGQAVVRFRRRHY